MCDPRTPLSPSYECVREREGEREREEDLLGSFQDHAADNRVWDHAELAHLFFGGLMFRL